MEFSDTIQLHQQLIWEIWFLNLSCTAKAVPIAETEESPLNVSQVLDAKFDGVVECTIILPRGQVEW